MYDLFQINTTTYQPLKMKFLPEKLISGLYVVAKILICFVWECFALQSKHMARMCLPQLKQKKQSYMFCLGILCLAI